MLEGLRRRLEPVGLDLIGVAAVRDYDARVSPSLRIQPRWPGSASAVVIGGGGRAFWDACGAAPCGSDDPLDRFAEHCVESRALDLLAPLAPVPLYPHRFSDAPVSFSHLAECAGLGMPSLLGILIRPDYGTWFALRAAILVAAPLSPTPGLAFDPCPSCAKPCIAACPAGAVVARGWDIPTCAAHRLEAGDCGAGCHSRLACPVGREHGYPVEAQRHHQGHALAAMRRAMAASAGAAGAGGADLRSEANRRGSLF
jgi:hypothetical protein